MAVARRVKSIRLTNVTSGTVTFDENTPLDNTYTLFAVVHFSGTSGTMTSNSWGVSAATGSGSNGSANYLGGFATRANGSTNDFTITLNTSVAALAIDLYAFDGFVSTTVEPGLSGSPASSTNVTVAGGNATTGPNRIAIVGIGLSGAVTFSESWTNGFETNISPTTPSRMDSAVLAVPTAGTAPSTSTTLDTARTQRGAMWYIQGVPANVTTTPADTTAPVVRITSLANGDVIAGTIALTATVTDSSAISSVKFYFEDTFIGDAVNTSGTTWTLSNVNSTYVDDGPYAVQAVAVDAANNTGESEILVTVRNTPLPTGPTSRLRFGDKDAKDIARALRIYLGKDRIFGPVYTPPVNGGNPGATAGGIPAQSTMPTAPYSLYTGTTYTWSASSGPMSAPFQWLAPNSSSIRLGGAASKGTVPGSISGFVRPAMLQDMSSAGTGTSPWIIPPYQIKLVTDSTDVYFLLAQRDYTGMTNVTNRASVQLKVNGKLTSLTPTYVGAAPGFPSNPDNISAGQYYLRVTFPAAENRTIELTTHLDFGGVAVNSNASIGTPAAPTSRIVFVDGSLSAGEKHQTGNFALSGGAAGTYTGLSSFAFYAAHALGYSDFVNVASGSSGYAISGDSVSFKMSTKVSQDVTAHKPDTIFVGSGNNDIAGNRTASELGTDTNTVYAAIKAANPNALLIAMGCPTPPVMGTQSQAESIVAPFNAAMKASAQANGFWFVNPATGQTYNPSGTLVSTTQNWISGNSSIIASDGQHPTQEGSRTLADMFVAAIKQAHPGTPTGQPTNPTPTPTPTNPVSSGAPTRISSFGPNGTHWPSRTPWVKDPQLVTLAATACTWAAIKTQIDLAVSQYPDAKVKITVPPGTLTGSGSGSTSTPVLQNVGAVNRLWKILVVPRDGAFSITHSASARIDRAKGITFAGFSPWGLGVAEADAFGVVFTECTDVAWGWSKARSFGITTSSSSYTAAVTDGVTFFECVAPEQGFYGGDRCAFRNGPSLDKDPDTVDFPGGITKNVVIDGCWYSAVFKPAKNTAHCDALQLSGRTSRFHGITIRDTYMNGATNAVFITTGNGAEQTETTRDVLIDHSALVGGLQATTMYPLPATGYAMTSGPVALNGNPVNAEIKDSLISGKIIWSDIRKVTNTIINAGTPSAASGSFTTQSGLFGSLADFDARGISKPTDSTLQTFWSALS